MIQDSKCKICRRQGEKLFLKGERCYSAKCAMIRKPYAPGIHGKGGTKRRKEVSEFSRQLHEKQRVRLLYSISERQFSNYVSKALAGHGGDVIQKFVSALELRLDNTVFRLGFAVSRSVARQIISHGHITVDGKKVFVPSYRLKVGQRIGMAQHSVSSGVFKDVELLLKKHETSPWLLFVPEKHEGTVNSLPKVEDMVRLYDVKSIMEYYSR